MFGTLAAPTIIIFSQHFDMIAVAALFHHFRFAFLSFFPSIQQHFQFTLSRHRDTLLLILKSNGSEKTTAHSLYHPSSFCHVFIVRLFSASKMHSLPLSFWNISHSKNIWWKRRGSDWYHFVHPFSCFKIIILCKMLFMMMIRLFFLPLSIHHVKNAMARWICDLSWFDCFFFCLFALSYHFFSFFRFFLLCNVHRHQT